MTLGSEILGLGLVAVSLVLLIMMVDGIIAGL